MTTLAEQKQITQRIPDIFPVFHFIIHVGSCQDHHTASCWILCPVFHIAQFTAGMHVDLAGSVPALTGPI
jgi:hypothetical protein